jgi:hypothetical protein
MTPADKSAESSLDRMFFAIATRGWDPSAAERYPDELRRYNTAMPAAVKQSFELIDGKATGLLTHVSLMIAGLGLVAPLVATSDIEIGIVMTEIAVYLLIAVGCLRCLSLFNARALAKFADDRLEQLFIREMIIRRELYRLCISTAIVFTMVVFLLLPLLYLWKPEK